MGRNCSLALLFVFTYSRVRTAKSTLEAGEWADAYAGPHLAFDLFPMEIQICLKKILQYIN